MSAQRGRDMLLKIENDAGEFITVAGLRTKAFRLNSQIVDITDQGSDGWRELLPHAGIREAQVTGSGVFRDAASDAQIRTAFFEQNALTAQLILPDFGTLSGDFLISGLSYAGTYQGEATFELTLASAGPIGFIAL